MYPGWRCRLLSSPAMALSGVKITYSHEETPLELPEAFAKHCQN